MLPLPQTKIRSILVETSSTTSSVQLSPASEGRHLWNTLRVLVVGCDTARGCPCPWPFFFSCLRLQVGHTRPTRAAPQHESCPSLLHPSCHLPGTAVSTLHSSSILTLSPCSLLGLRFSLSLAHARFLTLRFSLSLHLALSSLSLPCRRSEEALRPFQGLRILDVGCGGGLLCEVRCDLLCCVAQHDAAESHEHVCGVQGSAHRNLHHDSAWPSGHAVGLRDRHVFAAK